MARSFFICINMLMDIFEALLLFVVGFFAGGQFILNSVRNFAERELTKHHLPKSQFATHLNVEQINNIYYIFDTKSNVFVCQGNTLEETFINLLDRGVHSAFVTFNDQQFVVKDGAVMELIA